NVRLILFEGSGCDCLLMQATSLLDNFSFDLFPPFENGLAAPEVVVSRRMRYGIFRTTSVSQGGTHALRIGGRGDRTDRPCDAIHSPEAWASVVVKLTMPAV